MSIINNSQPKSWPFKTRALLAGSVACLGLVLSSCTSTGDGSTALQLNTAASGSVIADALQSAADETVSDQETAKAEEAETTAAKPDESKTDQLAAATAPAAQQENKPENASPDEATRQAEPKPVVAAAASPSPKTSLFSLFGKKTESSSDEQVSETIAAASAEPAATPASATEGSSNSAEPTGNIKAGNTGSNATAKVAFASPQRPAGTQSSIARLFNDDAADESSTQTRKLAVVKPATSARDYNYSLPGVRQNAGIEIKHRSSLSDDSDIDADEYDNYPSVQLASAPGLARLAPNGLRVQRETVDVACLKPRLVTMLKQMERHFRRPVMVTSGYRSPSYNRKVNGARRSLHMICAAADIQIDGVSKGELARYARSMPGRGGVGTYCHTKSVHVDIGPDRDWNWRCRR